MMRLSDIPHDSFVLLEGNKLEIVKGWVSETDAEFLRAFYAEHMGCGIFVLVSMGPQFHLLAVDAESHKPVQVEAKWSELCDWHLTQMDRLGLWPSVEDLLPRDDNPTLPKETS